MNFNALISSQESPLKFVGGLKIHSAYTATALGWLVLHVAAFTSGESSWYSFYRRLSEPHDQSGHEKAKKKISTPSNTQAIQPVAKHLAI